MSDTEVYPIDDTEDLERIVEGDAEEPGNIEEAEEDNNGEGEAEESKDQNKTTKPKRVVRNPQPKLNEQTLRGPKGLSALPGYFNRVKFQGRGHEEQDLNVLLKTYEYWCHRLFPKFQFDDCIEKLEKLGAKKGVQAHIRRIRMDIDFDNEEENTRLLSDHEEEPTETQVSDTLFDTLLTSSNNETLPQITEEQMERMRKNKERAEMLRQERLRKMAQSMSKNIEEAGTLNKLIGNNMEDKNEIMPSISKGVEPIITTEDEDHTENNITKDPKMLTEEQNQFEHSSNSPIHSNKTSNDEDILVDDTLKTKTKKKRVISDSEDEDPTILSEEITNMENSQTYGNKTNNGTSSDEDIHMDDISKTRTKNKRIISDSEDEDNVEDGTSNVEKDKIEEPLHQQDNTEDDMDDDFNLQLD